MFSVNGSHTYANSGSDTVSVSIADVGGSTADATSTATVASSGPTTDTWTSAATGDWVTDAADWSTGSPPNAGDVAEIASGTVQISSGLTLDNNAITIDSGAVIDITVTSGDIVTFDDGTTISGGGSGTLTVNSQSTLDVEAGGGSGDTLEDVTVNNSGAIDVGLVNSGAVLTLDDNTSVTGGTITVYSGNSLHVENGTTGASSVTVTLDDVNVDLHNSGTIQVEIIPPGGSSAATIDLQLTSGSIVNGGTLSIGGAGAGRGRQRRRHVRRRPYGEQSGRHQRHYQHIDACRRDRRGRHDHQ